MSTVLDIMDVQDQLCGLVRRMLIILDSQKLGSNILREHREEILDCLQGNKTAILSLSGALRTAGLIDSLTNNNVCSADFTFGPQTFLKCLEKVVDSKPQLLLKILSLMEKHECLRKVVKVMNKKCTSDLHEDASLDSKILKLEMEKEELQKKRNEKVFMLENEMQQVNLDSERQLRVKDKKLMALKDIIKNTPSHHDHNSHITSGRDDIDGGKVRHFEKREKELEKHQKLLMEKETEGRKRLEELQKRFHEMERKHKKELMEKNLQMKKFREEFFVGNF